MRSIHEMKEDIENRNKQTEEELKAFGFLPMPSHAPDAYELVINRSGAISIMGKIYEYKVLEHDLQKEKNKTDIANKERDTAIQAMKNWCKKAMRHWKTIQSQKEEIAINNVRIQELEKELDKYKPKTVKNLETLSFREEIPIKELKELKRKIDTWDIKSMEYPNMTEYTARLLDTAILNHARWDQEKQKNEKDKKQVNDALINLKSRLHNSMVINKSTREENSKLRELNREYRDVLKYFIACIKGEKYIGNVMKKAKILLEKSEGVNE